MKIRTRYAPSPTGRMHVGNLGTGMYAYLIAKHEGGDFLLRIEDTDQEREVEGAVDIIRRTLEETGLFWDEGPDNPRLLRPLCTVRACEDRHLYAVCQETCGKGRGLLLLL